MPPYSCSLSSASLVALVISNINFGAAYYLPSVNTDPGKRRFYRHMRTRIAASASSDADGQGNSRSGSGLRSSSTCNLSPNPYIRIQKTGRHYDIQTAITTFQRTNTLNDESSTYNSNKPTIKSTSTTSTVDLHAQIHFGDASYYQFFNDENAFNSRYDSVLYELIVSDEFLAPYPSTCADSSNLHLKQLTPITQRGKQLNPIAPTQADRNTASTYGLQCQVDGIQYCKEGWIHADLTREEFIQSLNQQLPHEEPNSQQAQQGAQTQQPLWALASTSASFPGSEFVTALLRPLTTTSGSSASATLTRRLFTHLFLPGDALSGWIRAILWLGVPTPELSIMLVDWSSLSYIGRQSRRRGGGGSSENPKRDGSDSTNNNIAPISPIAAPVLLSLLTGNWGTARRLVFGQVLVSGQSNADTSKNCVLIDKRNERALDVMRACLSSSATTTATMREETNAEKRIALLYGASHCRDLHRRLVLEEGMTPIRTEWRTAFRATAPRWGDFMTTTDDDRNVKLTRDIAPTSLPSSMIVSNLDSVAVGLVVLPMYLLVGGLDWVSTIGDMGNAFEGGAYLDGLAAALLYLVRHVALYVGISKFVVDWGGNDGVFDDRDK